MGFFDIFKRSHKGPDASQSPPRNTERRYHFRYEINRPDIVQIRIPSLGVSRVQDLSYRGCLTNIVAESSEALPQTPFDIELSASVVFLKLQVLAVHKRGNDCAFEFNHTSEVSLKGLASIIEPLRCGRSAIEVFPDRAQQKANALGRRRFVGDGPFDLILEESSPGNLIFVMATIRRGAEYGCVIWDGKQIITKKSMDIMGESARMAQTQDIDRQLVWVCAMACLGLKYAEGAFAAAVLHEWLTKTEPAVRNEAV